MKFLIPIFNFLYRALRFVAIRVLPKSEMRGQQFSNKMLRNYASHFSGSIINVSGWDDRDVEGSYYHQYFMNSTSYLVTNADTDFKGLGSTMQSGITECFLDLTEPLPPDMVSNFDVVLNLCTLEHIYEIDMAFTNLCKLSRDAVILVMPALQQIHIADYGDYWRMTPLTVYKKFKDHGFTPLVIKTNDQPFFPIYTFAIAVKNPEKYKDKITTNIDIQMGSKLFGSSLKQRYVDLHLSK